MRKVSVCIATHNGEKFVREQIESILCQLSKNDEVIISDDGSNDKTLQIIKDINDERIIVFKFKQNIDYTKKKLSSYYYASANFMNAIKNSTGDVIFLSDQDDIWERNKVSRCLKELNYYDIVSHNFGVIDSNGNEIEKEYLKNYTAKKWELKLCIKAPYRGCCLAFNRKIMEYALPYPKYLFHHDFWIGCNAALKGFRFKYIAEPLIKYRRHNLNVSELSPHNSLFFKISYRIKLLSQLLLHFMLRSFLQK